MSKTIKFSSNLRYTPECNEYSVKMIHKRFPWWILLCLLPLLLLIECKHDIKAHVFESESENPVTAAEVEMHYTSHFLFKKGQFFYNESIERSELTDDDGVAVFKDCPCSVFSYIFYCLSEASFSCTTECYAAKEVKCNFHYSRNVNLPMIPRREDLHIKVVDLESNDPLPDACVRYEYTENGKEVRDSVRTDAGGIATLKDIRFCTVMNLITASLYGYADTIAQDVPCKYLIVANDSTDMRLRRIKDQIEFFVKDIETGQPISEANCHVTLSYKSSKEESDVKTSIDGKGRGTYEDAFLLYTVHIKASKQNYRDSILAGGPYIVDKFNLMEPDKRTIWLTPVPYKKDFINVDSITGKPIPNVRNTIIVKDKDGKEKTFVETSNRNGVFPVVAKANESVVIISECEPTYWKKTTVIDKFDKADKKVPMRPKIQTLNFRTVKDANGSPILPDCHLVVTGSISGKLQPDNSGDGNFTVDALLAENLTIVASKPNFTTNNSTVNNTPVANLVNKTTDIPLKEDPLIIIHDNSIKGVTKDCHDLREPGSKIELTWKVCENCTMLVVMDGNGNVLKRLGHDDPNGNGKGVTHSPNSGTMILTVPTQTICIEQVDVNGHESYYRIRKL